MGDGTVDSNSLFYGPLKWSWEFQQKIPNAKAVKFIDYCSIYNEKYSIYDIVKG